MSESLLLGLDLGGGGVRCLLVDPSAEQRFAATRSWRFPVADGTFGLGYDLELDAMWRAIADACREALATAGADASAVAGISVSALRFGNVILDQQGNALFAVPNRDARGAGECFALSASSGEAILAETGLWPMPIHGSSRLLWLQNQRPEVLADADCFLSLSDWVNFRLCGVRASDPSQAGCTGLFELAGRRWSDDRIEALGLPPAIFPEIVESGTRIGALAEDAATDLGLRAGTPVGMGGGDTQCGLLGAGAIRPREVASILGTTAPTQVVSDSPKVDPQGRLWSGHHVVPGRWVLESNGGPMGETLDWVARLLFPDASAPQSDFLAEAAKAEIGSAGMLSTLGAEVMNARAPSMPVGQITLTHMTSAQDPCPRRHLARSIVEGYACAVRANLEQLAEVVGHGFNALALAGGMSRSDLLGQIIADVAQARVAAVAIHEATAMGAALCAGVAAGLHPDFEAAVDAGVSSRSVWEPLEAHADASRALYESWCKLRDAGAQTTAPAAAAHVTPWALAASSS